MRKKFFSLLLVCLHAVAIHAQSLSIDLNKGWQFRQAGTVEWHKAEVPGTIHTDLLSNGLIPDPFYRDNESKVQWVEEKSWEYQTSFDISNDLFGMKNITLAFDGLDTYADVFLNGVKIISADNMFRQWTADVGKLIKRKDNVLKIIFSLAASIAKNIKKQSAISYPDNERVFVRKAQYQFGWDWGPRLVTCGIWKGIRLIGWSHVRFESVFIYPVKVNVKLVEVKIETAIISDLDTAVRIVGLIFPMETNIIKSHTGVWPINDGKLTRVKKGRNKIVFTIPISEPYLWSADQANAFLYKCDLQVRFDPPVGVHIILDNSENNIFSLNSIQLKQEKDSIGESFYFTVDGKPTFIKGANWIPSDNFLPRAKKAKRYEQLIKASKEANINMLRVWGGGVYEDDEFYDLCDKYGIMVWQDFMFAGAMYPADSAFLKNIEEEVRYQVTRLRNHPCIALWCGNNEIEEAWFNWGWQKQFNYSEQDSIKLWNDYKKIFHDLIPGILKELDPDRPYWPSSPSLGWGRDSAYKKGDVHYWGVWWGKELVEKYNEKVGRFMSEYGMQGMPDMKTIRQFSLPQDRDTSSTVMKTHQKHPFGWQNIKYYVEQKFRRPKTFEDLVYVSQLMQADAIKTAIEAHRKNQPKTMGTMFWQWNDCWPVTSWSAVDYYGRKKAMYYEAKRSFRDELILATIDSGKLKLQFASNSDSLKNKILVFQFFSSDSMYSQLAMSKQKINLPSNKSYAIKSNPIQKGIGVKLSLISDSSKPLETILLFDTPKRLGLKQSKIRFAVAGNQIELVADKFAYGVYIDVPDGVELDDNYFHLLPNEKKIVNFISTIPLEKLKRSIKIKSLVDTY